MMKNILDPKQHGKSYICQHCGIMVSPADGHDCQTPVISTGTTIEEEQSSKVTIGGLKDAIIEMACELRRADSTTDSALCDAVDAYHRALREQAREGKS